MIQISNYKYNKDIFGSLHQVIEKNVYEEMLTFYSQNIYLDGKFYSKNNKPDKQKILNSIGLHKSDINHKFKILEEWDFNLAPANMLDLGCGYGHFISEWKKRGFGNGYGYDISNLAKPFSKYLDEEPNIKILDINKIKKQHFKKNTNVICAFDVIEHLFDVKFFLNHLLKSYNSFEYFIIEIPIISKVQNMNKIRDYKYFYPEHHIHLYTTAGIINEMDNVGFKLLGLEPLKSNLKNLLLFKNARIS